MPINMHAQMAHAPSVLLGWTAMRNALDEYGTFDRKTRTALLLTVAAADISPYTTALNSLIAQQSVWSEDDDDALRKGRVDDDIILVVADAGVRLPWVWPHAIQMVRRAGARPGRSTAD